MSRGSSVLLSGTQPLPTTFRDLLLPGVRRANAGFDAHGFLTDTAATGAHFLIRSSARRHPTPFRHLTDGTYLARLAAPYQAGHGYRMLTVRVIEAEITVTLTDSTVRREPRRLITSLLDPTTHPADELITLYHRRWQVETTYFSIKRTMLDGRVLRSRSIPGLDQEIYALLTTYQALIRTGTDIAATRPGLARPCGRSRSLPTMERVSFTAPLIAAGDTVTTARALVSHPGSPIGPIGRAVLNGLLPAKQRTRVKARTRKNPTSKVQPERPTTPPNRPGLHHQHQDHVLRERTCIPDQTVNATVLRFRGWGITDTPLLPGP